MIAAMSIHESAFWIGLAAVCIVASAFYSGTETGLYCVNRLRLRLAAHQDNRSAKRLQNLLADQAGLLFMNLVGNNLVNYAAPIAVTILFLTAGYPDARAELYTTLILTPVVFIFGEIVPKNLFQRHADRLMPRMAPFLWFNYRVFSLLGLAALRRRIAALLARRLPIQPAAAAGAQPRQAMYQLIRESAAEGALTATQMAMLERIRGLQSMVVGSVMAPWSQAVMVPESAARRDIEHILATAPHSRLPVWRGDRRHVVGVVHVLDLLTSPPETPVSACTRPSVDLAYDVPLVDALGTLQSQRRRMATVVDARGRCIGIITVKDLIEEILGELAAW